MAGFIISNTISNIIVCGLWTYISAMFAGPLIATWVGFAGCTSYYSAGCGKNGFIRSLCSNIAGIFIGCTIIWLCVNVNGSLWFNGLITGIFTGVIIYLTHCDLTKFANCTFIGGFSAFASGGNWKMLIICFILGNIVGLISDYFGRFILAKFFKKTDKKDWVIAKFLED